MLFLMLSSFLVEKEEGGSVDSYSFTPASGIYAKVEVIHYEDAEYRSDSVMEPIEAQRLWDTLKTSGYKDGGTTPCFVPDAQDAIVGASDPGMRALVMTAGLAVGFWACFCGVVALWV